MKLHDATPDQVPGSSAVHVGTAEPSEMVRLLTEPHAVLQEAGLNFAADATPIPVVVVPGAGATPSAIVVVPRVGGGNRINWVALVIVNGEVVEELHGPYFAQ
jgi:hypothetical protein